MLEIIRVATPEQLAECLAVRSEVFVLEQGVPMDLEVDEYDGRPDACCHMLVKLKGETIAAGRMKQYKARTAKLQRIAVLKSSRGTGVGRFLLNGLEQWAKETDFHEAILDAQVQAEKFYVKCGYETISDQPFLDAGMPHVRMRKLL